MVRPKRLLLLLATLSAAAVGAVACSGSSSSGSVSPTPTASPFVPVGCQIVWVNKTADPNLVDYYIVDGPVAIWRAGTTTANFHIAQPPLALTSSVTGALVRGFSLLDGSRQAAMIATAGTFQVTLTATSALSIGASVGFQDMAPHHYFLIDTAGALTADEGSSGVGSFSGVWSKPDSVNVAPGTGTVGLLFQGSALTLGRDFSYARCYQVRPVPSKPRSLW